MYGHSTEPIQPLKVFNVTRKTIIADRAKIADDFFSRMVGLLNRKALHSREALIITHCQSIHMFLMRFAIDAVFVDKTNQVAGLVEGIKPFRLSPIFWSASFVIELPVGTIKESRTQLRDIIEIF